MTLGGKMSQKSQQLSMFASEGVNVWQQLLSSFAFGGGLEKIEYASRGLRERNRRVRNFSLNKNVLGHKPLSIRLLPPTPAVQGRERSSMTPSKRPEGQRRTPASRSGEDVTPRHRGLCSGRSFTRRPGDAYFRNDP